MPGTLFVVATPIGNLEDISIRALRVLREVDLIAAEDTRRTAKLLAHYEIKRPMVSLREHNERREAPRLVTRLRGGESIALVSDAGTPTISDPGRELVHAARLEGVPVVPIPGPSAVMTALAASGFPADRFLFLGFPPRSGSARQEWLETLAAEPGAVVCFEAPTRIHQTLDAISAVAGIRPILVLRELTKINETLVTHSTDADIPARGEFTLVVAPSSGSGESIVDLAGKGEVLTRLVEFVGEALEVDRGAAETMAARAVGVRPFTVRNLIKKNAISVKQQNS